MSAKFKKITKAAIKYTAPITIRLGPDKILEIHKIKKEFYIIEPERADLNNIDECEGSMPLMDGAVVIIGRKEITVQCFNMPDSLSRHHLLIKLEGQTIYLFDLHSRNSTYLSV
jgi:hypothetical protein